MTSLLFILFFLIAILFSMLGFGGGILYTPILLQSGLSYYEASATALIVIITLSITATIVYHFNSLVDWKIVFFLEPFSLLGAYFGGYNSKLIPEKFLLILFSFVMILSAFFMLFPFASNKNTPKGFIGIIKRKKLDYDYHINLWLGIPLSIIAGFLSSILGVGGGFAKIPLMTLIFRVPTKIAVATSSAMMILTASAGAIGHLKAGHVNPKLSFFLSIAAFLGSFIGSKISIKADKKFLDIIISIIFIATSIWMIFKAIFRY
ncbi:MAG: sulfite exporter TauE/SafE family protein [Candidatus Goldbacteria bacterium]|nr:sulfite exporter TauE/SafE family protein [Candidatus Goldiibacteriota bacterium]